MTFTASIDKNGVSELFGRLKYVEGTIVNTTSAATGTVETGLKRVLQFTATPHVEGNTTPAAVYPRTNTMPIESGSVSVRAQGAVTARWYAIGE
jgi:hypothetical protein